MACRPRAADHHLAEHAQPRDEQHRASRGLCGDSIEHDQVGDAPSDSTGSTRARDRRVDEGASIEVCAADSRRGLRRRPARARRTGSVSPRGTTRRFALARQVGDALRAALQDGLHQRHVGTDRHEHATIRLEEMYALVPETVRRRGGSSRSATKSEADVSEISLSNSRRPSEVLGRRHVALVQVLGVTTCTRPREWPQIVTARRMRAAKQAVYSPDQSVLRCLLEAPASRGPVSGSMP